MLESHTTPRHHLLRKASTPGRPLIVYLGGFSQRVELPSQTHWYDRLPGQWRKNAVTESGLLDLAAKHDLSVCWIASARRAWAPWWARDWSERDVLDVVEIGKKENDLLRPSKVFLWGFSDGASLVTYMAAWGLVGDCFVAHSGLDLAPTLKPNPSWLRGGPLLLVCGSNEPHRVVRASQEPIRQMYEIRGRKCELWELPGLGHEWSRLNDEMLAWCLSHS